MGADVRLQPALQPGEERREHGHDGKRRRGRQGKRLLPKQDPGKQDERLLADPLRQRNGEAQKRRAARGLERKAVDRLVDGEAQKVESDPAERQRHEEEREKSEMEPGRGPPDKAEGIALHEDLSECRREEFRTLAKTVPGDQTPTEPVSRHAPQRPRL
jgi:hypothetical protein